MAGGATRPPARR